MTTPKKKVVKKKAVKKKVVKKSPAIKKDGVPHKPHNRTGKKRGTYKATDPRTKVSKKAGAKLIVLTPVQIEELTRSASISCTYREMAHNIGTTVETLRRCREDQSGVQSAIDKGKTHGTVKLKNKAHDVANVATSKFKAVNWSALQYLLNNTTEFSTQLELSEGTAIPKDVDISDDEAVVNYLEMIKKPK